MYSLKMAMVITVILGFCSNLVLASIQDDIKKANKKGKVILLVVTEKGDPLNKKAMQLAKNAQKSVSKSLVLELNKSNPANSALIKEYRLAGSPTPLLLVIATNGYVAGGAPFKNLTADALVKMVPSPKEEVVIKALNEEKSVFVVFTKKSDSKNRKQLANCQSACKSMGNKAVTVNVDIDNKNEKQFIEKFNIDKKATFPMTYVVNAQGQVTSTMNGISEAKSLVTAAKKKVSSGCCPPGSGKTCK